MLTSPAATLELGLWTRRCRNRLGYGRTSAVFAFGQERALKVTICPLAALWLRTSLRQKIQGAPVVFKDLGVIGQALVHADHKGRSISSPGPYEVHGFIVERLFPLFATVEGYRQWAQSVTDWSAAVPDAAPAIRLALTLAEEHRTKADFAGKNNWLGREDGQQVLSDPLATRLPV